MEAYLLDWANLLLRWFHLIAGIAWIGASFYFVMLDNSLKAPKSRKMPSAACSANCGRCMAAGFIAARNSRPAPRANR